MSSLLSLLREALNNPQGEFRKGQEEAIQSILTPPHRALVVQATGWGKSMVYFLATKILRDQGRGPTLVISPLLSLMRNQIHAAERLGLKANYYTSGNTDEWEAIEATLKADTTDLLLISPERLASDAFRKFIASSSLAKVGLIVIDEAHCISDWGHDFRPDYQRLGELVRRLPSTTSVLATTATANIRVIEDIMAQIGDEIRVIRGTLARKSLQIQVIPSLDASERLAWLADHLNDLPGSGIIYALTVRDANRVATWLTEQGYNVAPYHAGITKDEKQNDLRPEYEDLLLKNEVKALVATVALGMGFDKPDLGFVVHYQSPGNLVAYYQQIGRAGRAIENAKAILFMGEEDTDIHGYFIENAKPPRENIEAILAELDAADGGLSVPQLTEKLNLTKSEVEKVLKILSVLSKSPIVKVGSKYQRTPDAYKYDQALDKRLRDQRLMERVRFESFAKTDKCYMELVRQELDDPTAQPCGRCSNCLGEPIVDLSISDKSLQTALIFLNRSEFAIEARRQWSPAKLVINGFSGRISPDLMCSPGLCLSQFGDPGFAAWVREDKISGHFRDELVSVVIQGLARSMSTVKFDWVTAVPSLRNKKTVPDFARRVAAALGIPFVDAVVKVKETDPQKNQRNNFHQAMNLDGAFEVRDVREGTVLLIDDMVDSRWTFTIIGALLRQNSCDCVVPLALASTKNRSVDE